MHSRRNPTTLAPTAVHIRRSCGGFNLGLVLVLPFLEHLGFSIVSSEPRAWPQSHDSRVGGHAHRTSSTTPRHPRSHYASPSGRDTRRRPSMAMRMHAIVAKQVCKPRKARCHTWNARCANLGKHVVTPGKPGVQTSERMLPNLESQVCKPPKPFGQTHAAVLTNPRCHTAFLGKTAAKPKVNVQKSIGREVRTYPSATAPPAESLQKPRG